MNPENLKKVVKISEEIDDLSLDISKLKDLLKKMTSGSLRDTFRTQLIDECNYTFTRREIEALIDCKKNRINELTEELRKL